ncbi:MAG TPA: hypothetical protein ENK48_06735 [Gammaproteobacteria bacterium]|nr:hypothetical protein [Gammaproteobacteria bacterium]
MNLRPVMILLMALCAVTSTVSAASLGRLFTTPGERARLDRALDAKTTGRAVRPSRFTFNGYMAGSDGRHAEWINGHRRKAGVRLRDDGRVLLRGLRWLPLKPGQTLEADTGRVFEAFDRSHPSSDPGRS